MQKDLGNLRLPPQSLEAEQSILGGLLLRSDRLDVVLEYVTVEDFYSQNHRLIFQTILDMGSENQGIDVVTVSNHLEKAGDLETAGGLAYIGSLANNTPGIANITKYSEIVRDAARERGLLSAAMEIADVVYGSGNTEEKIDKSQGLILEATEKKITEGPKGISDVLSRYIDDLEYRYERKDETQGISTSFYRLDHITGGFEPGELIVIAGRPSMGKTALALNISTYAAVEKQKSVLFFSLEMTDVSLAMRLTSSVGSVPMQSLKSGKVKDDAWPRINSSTSILDKANLHIDETSGVSIMQMKSRCRRIKKSKGLDMVVIDYLQLVQGPKEDRKDLEIAAITKGLKQMAKELNVPVVLLSQLNRDLEKRSNKRPLMSDLRESGAIEQDADLIIFTYRDDYYKDNEDDHDGLAEIIISKQRNGQVGTITLGFEGEYARFVNTEEKARGFQKEPAKVTQFAYKRQGNG